jgi:hypothetical protein
VVDGRAARGRADEVGPGVGAVGVNRGDLPDRTLGVGQAADEEAVDPDQFARPGGLDVRLRFDFARRLVRGPVTGDQRLSRLSWNFVTAVPV